MCYFACETLLVSVVLQTSSVIILFEGDTIMALCSVFDLEVTLYGRLP